MSQSDDEIDIKNFMKSPVKPKAPKKPAPKKTVGRPRKTIMRRAIVKEGIVDVPSNLNSVSDDQLVYSMRLLYENPAMFKNIFNLLKCMESDSISIRFEKTKVKMFTTDFRGHNRIYIVINGDKMNSYYCEKTMDLDLSIENPMKVFQSLQKEITEIELATTKKWETDHIAMNLHNETMSMTGESELKVDLPSDEDCWSEVETALAKEKWYPVKFDLPFKVFKQTINKIHNILGSDGKFTIEKTGMEHIRFKYDFVDGQGNQNESFKDSGKINLRSSVQDGEPFASPIFVDRLKRLSGTMISENISLSVSEREDLIFTMLLDQDEDDKKKLIPGTESSYIKVLTKLVESS